MREIDTHAKYKTKHKRDTDGVWESVLLARSGNWRDGEEHEQGDFIHLFVAESSEPSTVLHPYRVLSKCVFVNSWVLKEWGFTPRDEGGNVLLGGGGHVAWVGVCGRRGAVFWEGQPQGRAPGPAFSKNLISVVLNLFLCQFSLGIAWKL